MSRRLARGLCLAMICGYLIAGWWPFFPRNHVSWLTDRQGLAFRPEGIVYDPEPLPESGESDETSPGLTVELSLEPGADIGIDTYILTIYNPQTGSSLVLCQWRSSLQLRIPDRTLLDSFRQERVYLLPKDKAIVLTVSMDSSNTSFYVDGQLVERAAGFGMPPEPVRGQLILGDSATGKRSWTGKLFGVALFNRALEGTEVATHATTWAKSDGATLRNEPGLMALYTFDEGDGGLAIDKSSHRHQLVIGKNYVALRKSVLSFPRITWPLKPSIQIEDVILNVVGFVPFGFLLLLYRRSTPLFVVLMGTIVSLTIEVGQVWLPTRDSSSFDIICNTAGTILGVVLAKWIFRPPAAEPKAERQGV